MPFDTVDFHAPVAGAVSRRIMFGGEDVGVLAKKVAPFPKAHANIKDGGRLKVAKNANDRRDGIRAAAGHIRASTRK